MLVTLVMQATCIGLRCGIGILFGIVGLLLKFGGKVLAYSEHSQRGTSARSAT